MTNSSTQTNTAQCDQDDNEISEFHRRRLRLVLQRQAEAVHRGEATGGEGMLAHHGSMVKPCSRSLGPEQPPVHAVSIIIQPALAQSSTTSETKEPPRVEADEMQRKEASPVQTEHVEERRDAACSRSQMSQASSTFPRLTVPQLTQAALPASF